MNEVYQQCIACNDIGPIWTTGIVLVVAWVLGYLLAWVGAWVWAWIDDSQVAHGNPLLKFVNNKLLGGTYDYHRYTEYRDKKGSGVDDTWVFFRTPVYIIVATFLTHFYVLGLFVISTASIAITTRFVRRLQKKFDKHVEDKEAHQ